MVRSDSQGKLTLHCVRNGIFSTNRDAGSLFESYRIHIDAGVLLTVRWNLQN